MMVLAAPLWWGSPGRYTSMSPQRSIDLQASTIDGVPELTVVDCCSGGVLVRSAVPFEIGTTTRIRLFTPDGGFSGTFALRCLHAHRDSAPSAPPEHLSALVFVDDVDATTRDLLMRLGDKAGSSGPTGAGSR